jgi:hypothetical protein
MSRVPNSTHEAHPWVISQIAPDFKLLDAWALPAEGGRDEFAEFLEMMATIDPVNANTGVSSALFRIRLRLGKLFGWDDAAKKLPIPGCEETTLRERLPDELRDSARGFGINPTMQRAAGGFAPVYRTSDEAAAEISNGTVHGVLHLGWVAQGQGRYQGEMGIYVKPRGWAGEAYLKLIEPFRHLIVYPAMMRQIERAWAGRGERGAVRKDKI